MRASRTPSAHLRVSGPRAALGLLAVVVVCDAALALPPPTTTIEGADNSYVAAWMPSVTTSPTPADTRYLSSVEPIVQADGLTVYALSVDLEQPVSDPSLSPLTVQAGIGASVEAQAGLLRASFQADALLSPIAQGPVLEPNPFAALVLGGLGIVYTDYLDVEGASPGSPVMLRLTVSGGGVIVFGTGDQAIAETAGATLFGALAPASDPTAYLVSQTLVAPGDPEGPPGTNCTVVGGDDGAERASCYGTQLVTVSSGDPLAFVQSVSANAHVQVGYPEGSATAASGFGDTVLFFVDSLTPGVAITSASGHDYSTAPEPTPGLESVAGVAALLAVRSGRRARERA